MSICRFLNAAEPIARINCGQFGRNNGSGGNRNRNRKNHDDIDEDLFDDFLFDKFFGDDDF